MASVEFNLANGIRCVAVKKAMRFLVTTKVFVKAGSRHDEELPGLAHVVEHLLFRTNDLDFYRNVYQIEGLGGKIESITTKEYTEYSLVIIKENWSTGLRLLSEILTKPEFDLDSIKREKDIIIEEIANSYSKLSILWDIFAQSIWKESPLRNPIRGYTESINEINRQDIEGFYCNYYSGCNMIIIVIGDIDIIKIQEHINEMFSGIKPGYSSISTKKPQIHTLNHKKEVHVIKDSLQTNLLMGYPGVSIKDPGIKAFRLVNKIIGNGESSRLYKQLRICMNSVYSISSTLAIYEDTGYFAVWTNFNHTKKNLIINALVDEFNSLRKKKIDAEELKHAKVRYKRDIMINHDNDNKFADFMGTSLLLTGKIKEFEDIIFEIDSVTSNQLYELANNYFFEENRFLVSIGRDAKTIMK
jgi:predicted Zn-dependent peptidase